MLLIPAILILLNLRSGFLEEKKFGIFAAYKECRTFF